MTAQARRPELGSSSTGWKRFRKGPLTATPIRLGLSNIYVLPTPAGLMFGLTLLILLVASINFQLSLGYALTFLLGGAALTSVFWTFRTLSGLNLSVGGPPAVFAGSPIPFTVHLDNRSARKRYAIGVALQALAAREWSWLDIEPQAIAPNTLAAGARKRGWQPLPALIIESRFPMGMFRAWTVWQPVISALVYPAPEADAPPLPAYGGRGTIQSATRSDADAPDGSVRPYRPGDPLNRIAWKKIRADGELISREPAASNGGQVCLSLETTGLPRIEAQISRLTAWVLQAHALGISYELTLGSRRWGPDRGESHKLACLRALALYRAPLPDPGDEPEGR